MARITWAASPDKTRKACTTGMAQAPANQIVTGTDEDKLNVHRVQRLAALFGITDTRARVVAALAWGGFNG